ncbi:MAG: hypothetical protein U5L76_00190 [Patescibacteria group bacterium]|nr:hypothetical protein [Patescibacteria group bacterium]
MKINFSKIVNLMRSLFLRYFKILAIVLAVLILVLGFLFIVKPKWNEVKETGIFDLNAEKEKKEDNELYLSRLKESLDKFKEINQKDIDSLSQIIPSKKEIPELFIILEDLVSHSALSLDSITFSEGSVLSQENDSLSDNLDELPAAQAKVIKNTSVSKNINILNISLSISGGRNYNDLKTLLNDIEEEQRIMDISSLSFNPQSQSSIDAGMNFGLNLKTYYIERDND